jgi:septum formation protein
MVTVHLGQRQLVLLSASPRRRDLLRQIGLNPVVERTPAMEASRARDASTRACENALEKMSFATTSQYQRALFISADTVVILGDQFFGKPADADEAKAMLYQLNGPSHFVVTAVVVRDQDSGRQLAASAQTEVSFRTLSQAEIATYVGSEEPYDKAGGYAIQGLAGHFIERIDGCYFNVVGLPLALFVRLLKEVVHEE